MSPYQQNLNERLRSLILSPPPAPWRLLTSIAVGGFEALGFSEDSRYLLVVSSSGRGVFDCETGTLVARERSNQVRDWYDLERLTVVGIGPLSNGKMSVAGIHGGGLPVMTLDGWVADLLAPDWPNSFVTLSPPGSSPSVPGKERGVMKVAPVGGDDTIECFGFSWSRKHLIVAMSHTIDFFIR